MSVTMLAVTVVRDGVVPLGANECCAESGGAVLLVGTALDDSLASITCAHTIWTLEVDRIDPSAIATHVRRLGGGSSPVLVLPASPDGRDLAPHLARELGVALLAPCVEVRNDGATVVRTTGRVGEEYRVAGPFVATLLPGVRGVTAVAGEPRHVRLEPPTPHKLTPAGVRSVAVLPPDPETADLTEAGRIVAGGQGLGSGDRFALLGRIGTALGASLGGTRVASDAGWIPFERQIGTTGVTVDPSLYLAFGISGATQHTSGLGDPEHVISVNLDGSCPMMSMADLAIVSDAPLVLEELAARLGVSRD